MYVFLPLPDVSDWLLPLCVRFDICNIMGTLSVILFSNIDTTLVRRLTIVVHV